MNEKIEINSNLQSRKERKRQINRETIIKYAEKEFIEKGYENTRVEDIAFNSGNSKATIYNYFPSKEDILTAVICNSYRLFNKNLLDELNSSKAKNGFRKILESYLNFDESYPYYSSLLISIEAIKINVMIYEKISLDQTLTESELEYKDLEAETMNLFLGVFTKSLNKNVTESENITKLIQAFVHFAYTIREIIVRDRMINRPKEETMEQIEIMFKIIELGIENYK